MVAAAVAAELSKLVRGVALEDPPFHTMGNRIDGTTWQALFIGMREAARSGGPVEELLGMLADIRMPVAGGVFKRLGELLTPVIEGRWLAATISPMFCLTYIAPYFCYRLTRMQVVR